MITTFDTTIERIPGVEKTYALNIHSTEPGTLDITYPTGITGPATATVAGERVWRNGLKPGGYVSCDGAATADRVSCTILFDIDWQEIFKSINATTGTYSAGMLFANYDASKNQRVNWGAGYHAIPVTADPVTQYTCYVDGWVSANSGANITTRYGPATVFNTTQGVTKYAIIIRASSISVYCINRATIAITGLTITGTMGGTEYLLFSHAVQNFTKINREISTSELDDWFASNAIPVDQNLRIAGGHENTGTWYDTSGTNSDLGLTVYPANLPAPKSLPDVYTDTGFTSPAFSIPITIAADCAAGAHEIAISRTRVGVPARASDAEKYDTASVTVTVSDLAITGSVGPVITKRAKL